VRVVRNQVISRRIVLREELVPPVIRRAIKLANVPPPGRSPQSPVEAWSDDSTANCAIQGDFISGPVRV